MSATKSEKFFVFGLCQRAQPLEAARGWSAPSREPGMQKEIGRNTFKFRGLRTRGERAGRKHKARAQQKLWVGERGRWSKTQSVGSWDSYRKSRWWRKWDTTMRSRSIWREGKAWARLQVCTLCPLAAFLQNLELSLRNARSEFLFCRGNVSQPWGWVGAASPQPCYCCQLLLVES